MVAIRINQTKSAQEEVACYHLRRWTTPFGKNGIEMHGSIWAMFEWRLDGGIWLVRGIRVVARRCNGLHSICQAYGAIGRSVDVCISVLLFQVIFLN